MLSVVLAALLAPLSVTAQPAMAASSTAQADSFDGRPVQFWNSVLLDVFKQQKRVGPGPLARAAAMMNAAIYDAESAYQRTWHTQRYEPYLYAPEYSGAPLLEGPDEEERVIGHTARNLLVRLFPTQETLINTRFQQRFGHEWKDFDILKPPGRPHRRRTQPLLRHLPAVPRGPLQHRRAAEGLRLPDLGRHGGPVRHPRRPGPPPARGHERPPGRAHRAARHPAGNAFAAALDPDQVKVLVSVSVSVSSS